MPAFEYQALDAAGRRLTGVVEADSARAARGALRDRGLAPLAVEAAAPGGRDGEPLSLRRRGLPPGGVPPGSRSACGGAACRPASWPC